MINIAVYLLSIYYIQGRARQLYKAGYRSLQHIASADPEQLVRTIEHLPRKVAKQLVTSAQVKYTYTTSRSSFGHDYMIPGQIYWWHVRQSA